MAGCFECGNERSGSIKWGKFFEYLRTCQLLWKAYAPCSCYGDLLVYEETTSVWRFNMKEDYNRPLDSKTISSLSSCCNDLTVKSVKSRILRAFIILRIFSIFRSCCVYETSGLNVLTWQRIPSKLATFTWVLRSSVMLHNICW